MKSKTKAVATLIPLSVLAAGLAIWTWGDWRNAMYCALAGFHLGLLVAVSFLPRDTSDKTGMEVTDETE